MSQSSDVWDVIVIGGGPPGENAAQYAVAHSDRTAVIVEAERVGGECSYWACMPSKALLRPVELVDAARHLGGVRGAQLALPDVLARRDSFTSHLDDSSQVAWAGGLGIDVVRGRGRLAGERSVVVTAADGSQRTLSARHAVVIATGTTASVPPVPGLREANPWTSRDVTNLHELPARVVILGGGVVACEAATWLVGLGAEVTLLEHAPGLLARNEPFAGRLVADRLRSAGAAVHVGAAVTSVARPHVVDSGYGHLHGGEVTVEAGGATFSADEIVVAAGRRPATTGIGLDAVGLTDGGFVEVDDHLNATGIPGEWLYVVGDANGRALLTHMGKYQGRVCGDVIGARAEGRPLDGPYFADRADHGIVPQVTFTDPEVASVGPTEQQAREAGHDVETVEYDLASVSGAVLLRDDYSGRAKLVIDRGTDTLLGATFVGSGVAELVHSATVAIVGAVPVSDLWHAVPSYPTVSEVWLRLLERLRTQRHG